MSLGSIALFLHIVGALGVFAALALEWATLLQLRRSEWVGQVREWLKLVGASRLIGGPSALTLLVTGGYLTATRWGMQPWIGLGILSLVLIAVLGATLTGRRVGAIVRALPATEEVTRALRRQLLDPALILSAWLRTGIGLGVIFLMTIKPAAPTALLSLGIATLLGAAAGVMRGGRDRRTDEASA
jgi:hypothetical protein